MQIEPDLDNPWPNLEAQVRALTRGRTLWLEVPADNLDEGLKELSNRIGLIRRRLPKGRVLSTNTYRALGADIRTPVRYLVALHRRA